MLLALVLFLTFATRSISLSWVNGIITESGVATLKSCVFDNDGNSIATGLYSGAGGRIVFADAATPFTLPPTAPTVSNRFVVKFSPQRKLVWFKLITGDFRFSNLESIATDRFNNIYVYGKGINLFSLSLYLTTNISVIEQTISFTVNPTTFLIKLSPTGNFNWVLSLPFITSSGSIYSLVIDKRRDMIYFSAGTSTQNANLTSISAQGPRQTLVIPGGWIRVICQYTLDGQLVWAARSTGFTANGNIALNVDQQNGDIVAVNNYVNGAPIYESSVGGYNAPYKNVSTVSTKGTFTLLRYNINGTLLWGSSVFQGPDSWQSVDSRSIGIDSTGAMILTGNLIGGALIYDPADRLRITTTNTGMFGTYLFKFASNGTILWSRLIDERSFYEVGHSIVVDKSDNIWLTGVYEAPIQQFSSVSPATQVVSLTGPNVTATTVRLDSGHGFVVRYSSAGVALAASRSFSNERLPRVHTEMTIDDGSGSILIYAVFYSADARFQEWTVEQPFVIQQLSTEASYLWYIDDNNLQALPIADTTPRFCTFNASALGILSLAPRVLGTTTSLGPTSISTSTDVSTKFICGNNVCFVSQDNWSRGTIGRDGFNGTTLYYQDLNKSNTSLSTCANFSSTIGFSYEAGDLSNGTYEVNMGPQYGYQNRLSFGSLNDTTFFNFTFEVRNLTKEFVVGFQMSSDATELLFNASRIQTRSLSPINPSTIATLNVSQTVENARWTVLLNRKSIILIRDAVRYWSTVLSDTVQSLYISTWEGSVQVRNMLLITPPLAAIPTTTTTTSTTTTTLIRSTVVVTTSTTSFASVSTLIEPDTTFHAHEQETSLAASQGLFYSSSFSLKQTSEPAGLIIPKDPSQAILYIGSPLFWIIIGGSSLVLILSGILVVALTRRRKKLAAEAFMTPTTYAKQDASLMTATLLNQQSIMGTTSIMAGQTNMQQYYSTMASRLSNYGPTGHSYYQQTQPLQNPNSRRPSELNY